MVVYRNPGSTYLSVLDPWKSILHDASIDRLRGTLVHRPRNIQTELIEINRCFARLTGVVILLFVVSSTTCQNQ
jgi:hypothetical protein